MKTILFWWLSMVTLVSMNVLGDDTEIPISNENSKPEPLVYSNSYIYQGKNGSFEKKMLTIASGKDGKYHYVKSDGLNIERGIWKAALPAMPHVDKIVAQQISDIGEKLSAVDTLISSFDSSLENYLKSLAIPH